MLRIKGDGQDFHSLIVADFDLDGDQDICSGGGPLSSQAQKVYIWENIADESRKEYIIAQFPYHEAVAGDVDEDGDIDICTKPWTSGNTHYYLENQLINSNQINKTK